VRLKEHYREGGPSRTQVYYWIDKVKLVRTDLANLAIVGMDDQCFTCLSGLFTSTLRERPEYFTLVIAVEFAPTWKKAHYVEPRGIPDNGDHNFFALNSDTWPLGNCDSSKVTMSCQAPFLYLERPQSRRRQFDRLHFASVPSKDDGAETQMSWSVCCER
jgi:hypothetical protein